VSYLSLYRKWRPGAFEDVLGQAHVTETLAAALKDNRVAHAYLFAGPRGTGKTSTARILAKALNCERGISATPCGTCPTCTEIAEGSSLDVFEMDAASHTSVDDVREIRERIPFAAVAGGHKVYIIDEAHQLSTPAFNALLKMLEEPPSHVVFVLCTTESHKLPATVVSRCQRFEFRRASSAVLGEHLARIAKGEGVEADEPALQMVARHAHGSFRDAISILDQAAGTHDGPVTLDTVLELLGEAPEDVLLELGDAIGTGDVLKAFQVVDRVVDRGWDPRQLLRQLLEHLRTLFLARRGADDVIDMDDGVRARLREQAQSFTVAHLEWALRVLGETQADVRWSAHPRLTLEVALARAARLEADDVAALRARVERLERALLSGDKPAQAVPAPAPPTQTAPAPAPPAPAPVGPSKVPAPAAREPAPPAAERGVQLSPDATLADRWAAVLETVRTQSRVTYTHLKEGTPIEIADGALVVGFDEKQKFHAEEIIRRPEQLGRVVGAIGDSFGQKLRFDYRVVAGLAAPGTEIGDVSPVDLVVKGLGAEIVEEVDG
jgi:DNA polymerase-3 subunit gamma/tau